MLDFFYTVLLILFLSAAVSCLLCSIRFLDTSYLVASLGLFLIASAAARACFTRR